MTNQSDDKKTTSTDDKAKPAQNKPEVAKDEISDTEIEKAAGGVGSAACEFKKS
jgi:hypothetical protein